MQSGGGAIYVSLDGNGAPAGFYSPRLNFLQFDKELALSVGTHIGLGALLSSEGGSYFVFDLPLMAEINFGHASTSDSEYGFGAYGGLGLGYTAIGNSGLTSTAGFVTNVGLKGAFMDRSYGLRISYTLAMNKAGSDIISVGLMYNILR